MLGHPNGRGNPQVQELEMDRNEDMYSMHNSDLGFPPEDRKYRMLEERLKAVGGQVVLGMDVNNLELVPEVRVQPKFKVHILDKYNITTYPKTYVKAYYYKMYVY